MVLEESREARVSAPLGSAKRTMKCVMYSDPKMENSPIRKCWIKVFNLVLGQTQFVGLKFGIFGGFIVQFC